MPLQGVIFLLIYCSRYNTYLHVLLSLDIIVIELYSTAGCPLEEAHEHCFLNQSVIYVVVLISLLCYCGDYAGYITVILPFLAFYLCSAYLLYLVSCSHKPLNIIFKAIPKKILLDSMVGFQKS